MDVFSSVCAELEKKLWCTVTDHHKDLKSTLDKIGHGICLVENGTNYSLKGSLKAIVAAENILQDFFAHLLGTKESKEQNPQHASLPESSLIRRDATPTGKEKLHQSCNEIVLNGDIQNCIHIELLSHIDEETNFKDFCSISLQQNVPNESIAKNMQTEMPSASKPSSANTMLRDLLPENSEHSSEPPVCLLRKAPTLHGSGLHKETKENSSSSSDATGTELDCSLCSYKTTQRNFLKRHMRAHFNEEQKEFTHQFSCSKCTYKTTRKVHYMRHIRAVHIDLRPYLCDLCGKTFKRQDNLKQHRLLHPTSEAYAANPTPFRCPICDKSCHSKAHLKEHQAVHSTARSFLCEICGASFKTLSVQRKHVNTVHRNPRSFVCQVCKKRFNTNYALRRHMKQHPSEIDGFDNEMDNVPLSQQEKTVSARDHSLNCG